MVVAAAVVASRALRPALGVVVAGVGLRLLLASFFLPRSCQTPSIFRLGLADRGLALAVVRLVLGSCPTYRSTRTLPQTTSLPSLVPLPRAVAALVRLLPLVLPEPQEPLV